MKGYKKIGGIILMGLALFALVRVYYRLTDDFRLDNIKYEIAYEPTWDFPPPPKSELDQLRTILQQPFSYIGKGAQCYAFASQDQKYVLKFFKFKHLKPHWLVDLIPPVYPFTTYKQHVAERKQRKLHGVFEGYAIAYKGNKEESAILYLHLMPTNYLKQKVKVIDKIGISREIDLDDVVFLVQLKGDTLRTRMHRLLGENRVDNAKETLTKIVAMYFSEYQKGMYDRDHGVMHNTGFIGERPFHLDVGKFSLDDSKRTTEGFKDDLEHVVWKIDLWIKNNYPQHYPIISAHLAELYQHYTGKVFDLKTIDTEKFKKRNRPLA